MTTFITKATINRLVKDIKQIIKNPLTEQGIFYVHDEVDMLKGYAMIIGASDTPYFGGFYFFELTYPEDYPHNPPKVKYYTNGNKIRFNPNLYMCGKVCVSLLNTWRGDQWTSCQSISTILLTLCTLLCKNPLLNEPILEKDSKDVDVYNEIIYFSNLNVAVCDIVSKKHDVYMPFFDYFYSYIKEYFIKNYDAFIEFSQQKMEDINVQNKILITETYELHVYINYYYIITKLKTIKNELDNPLPIESAK